jgi:hypothetical protein
MLHDLDQRGLAGPDGGMQFLDRGFFELEFRVLSVEHVVVLLGSVNGWITVI